LVATTFGYQFDLEFCPYLASNYAIVKTIYCTIVTVGFVPRALALWHSIARESPDALFGFYCADARAADLLGKYVSPNVVVVPRCSYETKPLRDARQRLPVSEYCWTCKPAILQHALASFPGLNWAIWLDSDMLAFGDIGSELALHSGASVVLTPHRFSLPEFLAYEPSVGRFNAGFVAFHNVRDGREALNWWMNRCLEGCPARPDGDRYADQKYLNAIPNMFRDVAVTESPGLNCAPWNVFEKNVESSKGSVTIDGVPLVLYHFQGLKVIRGWAFDLYGARRRLPEAVRALIYAPYVKALASQIREVAQEFNEPSAGIDDDFVGIRGLFSAAKRLCWSSNLVVSL